MYVKFNHFLIDEKTLYIYTLYNGTIFINYKYAQLKLIKIKIISYDGGSTSRFFE